MSEQDRGYDDWRGHGHGATPQNGRPQDPGQHATANGWGTPPTDSSPAPPVAWGADGGAPPEPFGAGRGWQSPQWGNPPGLHGSATGFAPTTHPGSPLPGASYADAPLPGTAYPGPPYPGTEYPGSQSPGTSYLGSPDRAVGPHGERLAPPTPIPGTSTGFSASRAFGATLGHLVTVLAAFFLGGILLTITTHLVFFWFADGPSPIERSSVFAVVVQLAALIVSGALVVTTTRASYGTILSGELSILPMLLTALVLVTALLTAIHAERRAPLPTLGARLLVSSVTGAGVALVLTVLSVTQPALVIVSGIEFRAEARIPTTLVFGTLLVAAATLVGRLAAAAPTASALGAALDLLRRAPRWARELAVHASVGGVVAVAAVLVLAIVQIIRTPETAVSILCGALLLVNAAVLLAALAHLGGISTDLAVDMQGFVEQHSDGLDTLTVFSTPSPWALSLVLLALVTSCVTAVRIGAARGHRSRVDARISLAFPVAVCVAWTLVGVVAATISVHVDGSYRFTTLSSGLQGEVGVSIWTPLVLLAWALVIELAAPVAPGIAHAISPRLLTVLAGKRATSTWTAAATPNGHAGSVAGGAMGGAPDPRAAPEAATGPSSPNPQQATPYASTASPYVQAGPQFAHVEQFSDATPSHAGPEARFPHPEPSRGGPADGYAGADAQYPRYDETGPGAPRFDRHEQYDEFDPNAPFAQGDLGPSRHDRHEQHEQHEQRDRYDPYDPYDPYAPHGPGLPGATGSPRYDEFAPYDQGDPGAPRYDDHDRYVPHAQAGPGAPGHDRYDEYDRSDQHDQHFRHDQYDRHDQHDPSARARPPHRQDQRREPRPQRHPPSAQLAPGYPQHEPSAQFARYPHDTRPAPRQPDPRQVDPWQPAPRQPAPQHVSPMHGATDPRYVQADARGTDGHGTPPGSFPAGYRPSSPSDAGLPPFASPPAAAPGPGTIGPDASVPPSGYGFPGEGARPHGSERYPDARPPHAPLGPHGNATPPNAQPPHAQPPNAQPPHTQPRASAAEPQVHWSERPEGPPAR